MPGLPRRCQARLFHCLTSVHTVCAAAALSFGCSGTIVPGADPPGRAGGAPVGEQSPTGRGRDGSDVGPPAGEQRPTGRGSDGRPAPLVALFDPPTRPRPVGRLTRDQFKAIAEDLFKVTLSIGDLGQVPPGESTDPTVNPSQYAAGAWDFATIVSSRAVAAKGSLGGYCARRSTSGLECARALVREIGPLVLRRRPTEAEVMRFAQSQSAEQGSDGLDLVLTAMLASPSFLFPTEASASPAVDDHFKLARLTLALWDSLPDAATVARFAAAARAGDPAVPGMLLADARAQRFFQKFAGRFVDVDRLGELQRSKELTPLFGSSVQQAVRLDLLRSLQEAFGPNRKVAELLTSPTIYVNRLTAPLYGVTAAGDAFEPRESASSDERAGLLTTLGVLALQAKDDEGSIVKRGVFLLQRVLCTPPPPPPEAVPPLLGPDAKLPQRARLAAHAASPACAGCHRAIDGLGAGLEGFDAIGRRISTDHGQPITGRGVVPRLMDAADEQEFTGPRELARILARSVQTRECLMTHVHRALVGRDSFPAEKGELEAARARFIGSGDLRGLAFDLLAGANTSSRF